MTNEQGSGRFVAQRTLKLNSNSDGATFWAAREGSGYDTYYCDKGFVQTWVDEAL